MVDPRVREMAGASALPRTNGELVFSAPWEGRVLGAALALVDRLDLDWDEFRSRLIAAIADDPERPYYGSWVVALEALVVDLHVASPIEIEARAAAVEP